MVFAIVSISIGDLFFHFILQISYEMKMFYFGFDGKYGGDKYEEWFCRDFLSGCKIELIRKPRKGGLLSLGSLAALLLCWTQR